MTARSRIPHLKQVANFFVKVRKSGKVDLDRFREVSNVTTFSRLIVTALFTFGLI